MIPLCAECHFTPMREKEIPGAIRGRETPQAVIAFYECRNCGTELALADGSICLDCDSDPCVCGPDILAVAKAAMEI